MSGAVGRVRAWQRQRSSAARESWRGTDALRRGLVLGVALVVAGLLLHRVATVLLGLPLLVGAVLALAPATGGRPVVRVRPLPRTAEAGQRVRLFVDVDPGVGAELIAIRLPRPDRPGVGPVHVVPGSARVLATRLRWDAWGERTDLRPDHLVAGPDALLVYGPVVDTEGRRTVLPPVLPAPAAPLPPRAAGLVGAHRSRRPGDGVELRDIRPYRAGDRLRGVDWRMSLRAGSRAAPGEDALGTLFVRERHAEADADVVLALDTRIDVGSEVGEWASGTVGASADSRVRAGGSLDTAVVAAIALGAGYLRQGDRVGLVDLGRPQLGLRIGAGTRQLSRLRHRLVTCVGAAGWAPRAVLRPEQVPPGALVVVLSPFLDDGVAHQALLAARRGGVVLAIDVLPTPLVPARGQRWGAVVAALITAERAARFAALRAHGVAVLPWDGGAALTPVLRRASRPRRPAGARR